ncbi:MAG: hypothetical protein R2759_11550 [Bacteroidales bacterium]
MKRLIAFLTLAGLLTLGITNVVLAQGDDTAAIQQVDTNMVDTPAVAKTPAMTPKYGRTSR